MTTAQSETDIQIGIFILKDQNREFFILRVIFMLRSNFHCSITVFNYTFIFIQVQEYTKVRRDNCKLNGFFTHFAIKPES
jgi:hypothetical protein